MTLTPVLPKNSSLSITPVAGTSGTKMLPRPGMRLPDRGAVKRPPVRIDPSKAAADKKAAASAEKQSEAKGSDGKKSTEKSESSNDSSKEANKSKAGEPADKSQEKKETSADAESAKQNSASTSEDLPKTFSEMSTKDNENSNVATSDASIPAPSEDNERLAATNLSIEQSSNVNPDKNLSFPSTNSSAMSDTRQQDALNMTTNAPPQDLSNITSNTQQTSAGNNQQTSSVPPTAQADPLSSLSNVANVQDLSMSSTLREASHHDRQLAQQHQHQRNKRPGKSSVSSEPLMGIVKPNVHESKLSSSLSSLQSMSNLLPTESPLTSSSSSGYSAYSSSSSSQPLFQPFLHSSSSTSSSSNIAQVAPHVQTAPYSSSQSSSYLSSSTTSVSSSDPPSSSTSLPSMQSSSSATLSSSAAASGLNFAGMDSLGQLSRPSSDASSHSLTNLLGQYDTSSAEELLSSASHSSALDYLNYSLSAGSSAFRRPDALTSELQSLLTPSSPAPTSGPSTPSPAPFPAHQSTYSSQYPASAYRSSQFGRAAAASSSAVGSYNAAAAAAYASQYSPYSSQYSTLAAAAAHASPSSSQAAAASASAAAAAAAAAASQYPASLQSNPYQAFSATSSSGLPPYSTGLGGFGGHGPYPPM